MLALLNDDDECENHFFIDAFGDDGEAGAKFDDVILLGSRKQKRARKHQLTPEILEWQQQLYAKTNIPRLVKSDIRRSYTAMLQNALNISDFPLLFNYFSTFCSRDVQYRQVFGENKGPHMPAWFQLNGLREVTQYFFNKAIAVPDSVYQITDTKIHSYSNTDETKITSDVVLCATEIYDIPYVCLIPDGNNPLPLTMVRNDTESGRNNTDPVARNSTLYGIKRPFRLENNMNMIDTSLSTWLQSATLYESPRSFSVNVQMTMYLNSEKLIEKMEFNATKLLYRIEL